MVVRDIRAANAAGISRVTNEPLSPSIFAFKASPPRSIGQRFDTVAMSIIAAGVAAWLCWISSALIRDGLSSGDDGYFALAAKAVSSGTGYGTWIGNGRFSPFDEAVGTGPALILPIAVLTAIFGPSDQMPGTATLAIFFLQLGTAALFLRRVAAWPNVLAFLSAGLLLTMLCSFLQWPFGVLVGEAVAFGFVLLGACRLAGRGHDGALSAGLMFGIAFMTKQISLFASLGAATVWIAVETRRRGIQSAGRSTFQSTAGFAAPVVAFELFKLISLGPEGYLDKTANILTTTGHFALGGGGLSSRIVSFTTTLGQIYFDPARAVVVICVALAIAALVFLRDRGDAAVLTAMLWAGAALHVIYFVGASTMWARYLWIAVAVGCFAICGPALVLGSWTRYATAACCGTALYFGAGRNLDMLHDYHAGLGMSAERAEVLRVLAKERNIPLVAPDWGAFDDIAYLSPDRRIFLYVTQQRTMTLIEDASFFTVIHKLYSDVSSPFVKEVKASCMPMTMNSNYITLYKCNLSFWQTYHFPWYLREKN